MYEVNRGRKPLKARGGTKVPPAWGLRRRFPGASGLMHPSDITRTFGPTHPSDSSRKAFPVKERSLGDPAVRVALMRRRRNKGVRSGNRFRALG